MSHEILSTDSFGYRGQPGWHKLGVEFPEDIITAEEACRWLEMDWDAVKVPTFMEWNGRKALVPNSYAHVRSDTGLILGNVSGVYRDIQNIEHARFTDTLRGLEHDNIPVETAGSLGGGKRVYYLLKLPEALDLSLGKTGRDKVTRYLMVCNHHGGTGGFQVYITEVRVVCENTRQASLWSAANMTQFSHLGDIEDKLNKARETMNLALTKIGVMNEQAMALAGTGVSSSNMMDYLEKVYDKSFNGKEDHKLKVIGRWEALLEDPRQTIDGIAGTLWAGYNAVSTWSDHERGVTKTRTPEAKFNSNLFGASNNTKRKAWNTALVLAGWDGPEVEETEEALS